MATIEERAKAYCKSKAIQSFSYCGYVKGATDQREIDATNALACLCKIICQDTEGEKCVFCQERDMLRAAIYSEK